MYQDHNNHLDLMDKRLHALTTYLEIAEVTNDTKLKGEIRKQLGICHCCIGNYEKAKEDFEVCLAITKEMGDKNGEGIAYGKLGDCHSFLGQYHEAIKYFEMSLTIATEIRDKKSKERIYGSLGTCYSSLGQYGKAIEYLQMFLAIATEIGDKNAEEAAYKHLGKCYFHIGQCDKAIECHKTLLDIANETGDKKSKAMTYAGILGTLYSSLGQYSKAIEYHQMFLAIATEIGDKAGEETACGSLGTSYVSLGQYDEAIRYFEVYLSILKEIGNKAGKGVYGIIGACYGYLGQYNKAIKYLEMSLTIVKEIGDEAGEVATCRNLGACYSMLGEYDKAIEYQEIPLVIATKTGDKQGEGKAYAELGACCASLGQYSKAIKYLEMYLTIAKVIGDKKYIAKAYGNLGACYEDLGQYKKNVKYQEMSLTVAKGVGDRAGESAAYGSLGASYYSLGQYDKAIECLDMFLNVAKATGDKTGEAAAYGNLGLCYSALGQFQEGIKYQKMHLAIAKEAGDNRSQVIAYGNLGACYYDIGQYDEAMKYAKMFLEFEKEAGGVKGKIQAYANLGRVYSSRGKHHIAESNFKKAVEYWETLFENAPKLDEDKIAVIGTFMHTYRDLMLVILVQERRGEALVVAEKGRSRALADLLFTNCIVDYDLVAKCGVADLHDIRKLAKTLGSTVLFFSFLMPGICAWIIQPNGDIMFHKRDTEVSEKYRQYFMENNIFRPNHSRLKLMILTAIKLMMSCEAVRCKDRSQNITRTPASVRQHEKSRQSMLECLLKEMYHILLDPVRQYLVGSQVIVVPDASLALVPFSALLDENGRYFAESFQVRLIPSLTMAKMIIELPEDSTDQRRPLVIGDPDVGQIKQGDKIIIVPKLEFAKKEVEVVGQFLKVKPLVGTKATKKRFLQKVESANLIHIAAHGDAERGEILLAPCRRTIRNNIEDIMVMISDLEGKNINAKLVVLSCCYSGLGDVREEGVIGIARAFLGAGARSVLVTLWAVDDGATLCLMYRFYEFLTSGDSAGEALHKAMKATRELEMFHHPHFWAPFVLLGEDVTPFCRS